MSLLEKAYETYKNLENIVGVCEEGKTSLPPISHIITNAQIEVTIDIYGKFHGDTITDKETQKTIIPVTESSAGRSSGIAPHALSDNLTYITNINIERHIAFLEQLEKWVNSEHSHKKAQAVFEYIKSGSLLKDLQSKNILKLDENGKFTKGNILSTEYEKCIVRWVVIGDNGDAKDVEVIKESLRTLFVNDVSSARPDGSMEVHKLYWWEHNSKAGQYSSAKVHRLVEVLEKVEFPTSTDDYEITVNSLDGLKLIEIDGI